MKARVFWESRHNKGTLDWEDADSTFKEWVESVAQATASGNGQGFLLGSRVSLKLGLITRIENLES